LPLLTQCLISKMLGNYSGLRLLVLYSDIPKEGIISQHTKAYFDRIETLF
jgi:hypothetical protein